MKKHNTFKIVLGFILFIILLTWIIPGGAFRDKFIDQGLVQMGLFDFFNYILTSFSYFGHIVLYIICIGGFYGVLNKVPAYRNLLNAIAKKVNGKEKLVLSLIVVFVAIAISLLGIDLELLIIAPFLISLILLMGFDKIVAAVATIGGTLVGVAGSTFAYNKMGMVLSMLSLDIYDEIYIKAIVLLVGLTLLIFNLLLYIKRGNNFKPTLIKTEGKDDMSISVAKVENTTKSVVEAKEKEEKKTEKSSKSEKKTASKKTTTKKNTSNSKNTKGKTTTKKNTKSKSKSGKKNLAALKDDEIIVVKSLDNTENKGTKKIWPLALGFILFVILLIVAFLPWDGVFKVNVFEEFKESILKFELFDFPIFAKLLGHFNSFGHWNLADILLVLGVLLLLISVIYKVKFEEFIDGFIEGAKKALKPAMIAALVYLMLIICVYHPFQLTIYKGLLGLSNVIKSLPNGIEAVLNILIYSVTMFLSSLFNGDVIYAAQGLLPYFTSVVTDNALYPFIGVLFYAIYGITMFVAPSSLILMSVLTYLDVHYLDWLKATWKFILEFFVVVVIIVAILFLL